MPKIGSRRVINKFGHWLNGQMLANNYTCEMLADMLHVSKQTVSNHVRGTVTPSYVFVVAYCSIFENIDDYNDIWNNYVLHGC